MPRSRRLTISQFTEAHPHITEWQLRYALRRRATNGLKDAIFKPRVGHAFLFDERKVLAWLTEQVPV